MFNASSQSVRKRTTTGLILTFLSFLRRNLFETETFCLSMSFLPKKEPALAKPKGFLPAGSFFLENCCSAPEQPEF